MDNQSYLNLSGSVAPQGTPANTYASTETDLFKEIFATLFGVHNINYLKENYLYFDKYGKQRKIEFAIFYGNIKLAVLFDLIDPSIHEEYRAGDRKIIESSLKSQGWLIYFWTFEEKTELVRKNTIRDLQRLIGREPKFKDHMDTRVEVPKKNKLAVPIILFIALVGAAIFFPKISDKLFSYSSLSKKSKPPVIAKTKKADTAKKFKKKSSWKNKLIDNKVKKKKNNNRIKEEAFDFKVEDFK